MVRLGVVEIFFFHDIIKAVRTFALVFMDFNVYGDVNFR